MPLKNKAAVQTGMAIQTGMATKNLERILFTTDFSAASEHAASYALMLAKQNKARLYVMHVVDVSNDMAGFYVPHMSYEILDKEMEDAAEGMIKKFCAKHFGGYKNVETIVAVGVPYKEIMNTINGKNINMVIMAASGMGEVGKLLFGSTADRVLRHAVCPVLVIPPAIR